MTVDVFGIIGAQTPSSPFSGSAGVNSFDGTDATDPVPKTTADALTMVVGGFRSNAFNNLAGAGYTIINSGADYALAEYQLFTSTQTALPVTIGNGTQATGTDNTNGAIGDAVVMNAAAYPAILPNITVPAANTTSATMSEPTGAGITNGDVIQFNAPGNLYNSAGGVAYTGDLFAYSRADLSNVSVVNFTNCCTPFGVLSTFDYNNEHFYATYGSQPGNLNPVWQAIGFFNEANIAGAPMIATETGWCTPSDGTSCVDRLTQARYSLNDIFDLFTAFSMPRIYFYELADQGGCTTNCFGVFDSSGNPTAMATAIKNLTTIFADAGSFSPGRFNYSISGMPGTSGTWPLGSAGSYQQLFENSSGHFFIVIWNEASIWNFSTQSEVTPPTSSITVNFSAPVTTAKVYTPITSSTPITTLSGVSSVSLGLAADMIIVEVDP